MAKGLKPQVTRSIISPMAKRELKEKGKMYRVPERFMMKSRIRIDARSTLRECTDGWYQLYTAAGDKSFLTFSEVYVQMLIANELVKEILT